MLCGDLRSFLCTVRIKLGDFATQPAGIPQSFEQWELFPSLGSDLLLLLLEVVGVGVDGGQKARPTTYFNQEEHLRSSPPLC